MTKYKHFKKTQTLTQKGYQVKRSIAKNASRAKVVGILYLVMSVVIAVAAFLPMMSHALAPVGFANFLTALQNINMETADELTTLINAVIYGAMMIGLIVNLIRALSKLGWLFKKSATENLGLNRNAYAMNDLGKIFSGSFAVLFVSYLLIALFCGFHPVDDVVVTPLLLIVLGVSVVMHLVLGFCQSKISYFNIEKGEIVEHKRIVGRAACLLRNLIQIVVIIVIPYFFLQISTLNTIGGLLVEEGGINKLTADMGILLQLVAIVCFIVVVKHATATTEYDLNGVHSGGMMTARIFALLLAVVAFATAFLVQSDNAAFQGNMIIVAIVSLVLFIVEIAMRKYPRFEEQKLPKGVEKYSKEKEFSLDSLPQFSHSLTYKPSNTWGTPTSKR